MNVSNAQEVLPYSLESTLLWGALAVGVNLIAKHKGFFTYSPPLASSTKSLKLYQVLLCFGIYLSISLVIAPLLLLSFKYIHKVFDPYSPININVFSVISLCGYALILLSMYVYFTRQDSQLFAKICKDKSIPYSTSKCRDFIFGSFTWFLGFPTAAFVGQLFDLFLYIFYQLDPYEQVAVQYLKSTLQSPLSLSLALVTILIAAPLIEEFLFRGLLQTWLKGKLGKNAAILIASISFALFHVAPSQGLGNISLVASLFSFACFLGFIYEKKGSLYASVGLHMTFNAVSTFRILFFTET